MVSDIKKEKTIMMNIAKLTTSPILKLEDIKSEIMSITPCPLVPIYVVGLAAQNPKARKDQQNHDQRAHSQAA